MKIAVVNQPLGNRGDESAHKAFIRALIENLPMSSIDVIFIDEIQKRIDDIKVKAENVHYFNQTGFNRAVVKCIKKTLRSEYMMYSYLHPLLRRYIKRIPQYDYVVCAPGGICMGGFMNWKHIWQLYIPKRMGIRILYWGRSIGPFDESDENHKLFKKVSTELISGFRYISLRDDVSFEIAKPYNQHPYKTVDSAFLECPIAEIPTDIKRKLASKEYVVFVPNELTWHYKYRNIKQHVIDIFYIEIMKLINEYYPECNIVMLPQTCKTQINDYRYFEKIKELSKLTNIIVINENQNSDVQQTIIRNARFMVGARYHSIIFAINNKIPFLALSYEHKMRGMLETLNLTDRQVVIEKIFDGECVKEHVFELIRKAIVQQKNIEEESEKAHEIVKTAFTSMIRIME